MGFSNSFDTSEFNQILLVSTFCIVSFAIILLCVIYLKINCGICRRSKRRPSSLPRGISKNRNGTHLSINCPDLDFIDSKNTNLISSTVRVDSVHQTPTIS